MDVAWECLTGCRRRGGSVAVGAAAGQHAGDLDHALGLIEQDECSPVADPQPPLRGAWELAQLTGAVGIGCERAQRVLDALADGRVKAVDAGHPVTCLGSPRKGVQILGAFEAGGSVGTDGRLRTGAGGCEPGRVCCQLALADRAGCSAIGW